MKAAGRKRIFGLAAHAIIAACVAACLNAQIPSPTPSAVPAKGPTGIFAVQEGSGLRKPDPQLTSALMARTMPYRVVLPADYSSPQSGTKRYPVVYLLHGLTGHYNNWTDKTGLAAIAAEKGLIIVTPEGDDGWYTDNATKPNDKYETYIVKELIPEIDKKFRTIANRDHRAIAGLSMGGYGAIKFGLKYPDMFIVVGSFSGALGAASITEKEIPGAIGRSIDAIFGTAGGPVRKSNDIFDMIRNVTPEKIKAYPFLYLDCGTEDFLFQNNREFVDLLVQKKVPHEFRELPGGHNWTYWNAQVEEFLELAEKRFTMN